MTQQSPVSRWPVGETIVVKMTLRARLAEMTFEGSAEEAVVAAVQWALHHPWGPIEVTVIEKVKDG
ncbi:hypothetical protein LCGC14_0757450 [marine sediment metagenome]|uniref:Uncharacterized protein n=1 Tax=marine sediment metagenome TaxID=412755 RepID=A0A0F9T972_9ZZZZ